MRLVFEDFEIDQDGSRLLRAGEEVALERRMLDLLCYLAEHPGRLIGKDELISQVWNATVLSESVLSNTIAKLRKALGQGARDREPIETVHGRGYRFHAMPKSCGAFESIASQARSEPFIGRHANILQLDGALAEVEQGVGRLVLISGEAGIGKSRMLDELASHAVARSFRTWRGLAYAGGAAPAYWPWVEIVRAALTEPEPRRHLPSDSWAIASLVPELLEPQTRSHDAHTLRFRLFDELMRWFAAASSERPCLIAIDDLQWADPASVELLDHLARGLLRQRVLLVAAVRAEPALVHGSSTGDAHALQRLFRSALHIELRGLSLPEVEELVVALDARAPDASLSEQLHALTQGNPFFVRQVVQLLAQRGEALAVASLEAAKFPPAVREVIQQRLAALPPETRALMGAASAIGQTFDAVLLACATQQTLQVVLPALEPALRLGVIRHHDSTSHRFDFNHALVCDSLYDEVSLARRGEIHAVLSRALAEHAPASDARVLGEIARHSLLAVPCDVEAAAQHCRRAAHASREASGFEAAAAWLIRALERLSAAGGYGELRCELLYQISLDHFCVGETEQAWRALDDGARLASDIGATTWLARCVTRVATWRDWRGFASDARDLDAFVDRALEHMDPAEGLYAVMLACKANMDPWLSAAERRELWVQAERLAVETCDPEVMLEVAAMRAFQRVPALLEDSRAAIVAYRALEARYPRVSPGIQHRLRHVGVELTAYWCALLAGDRGAAQLALAECEVGTIGAQRVPQLRKLLDMLQTARALSEGRLDDASARIEQARKLGEISGVLEGAWRYCVLMLAEAKNDLGTLTQLGSSTGLSAFDRIDPRYATGAIAWAAALFGKLGLVDEAGLLLTRVSDAELDRMPVRAGDLGSLCLIVEAYVAIGDRSRADMLYAKLEPYASLNAVGVGYEYRGSVAHYLGLLALQLDRPAVAARHFEAAIAFNEKLGVRSQVALGRELLERAAAVC